MDAPYPNNFQRFLFGDDKYKNACRLSFGYTQLGKPANAGTSKVMSVVNGAATAKTIATGITNPDAPRVLTVTSAGTAGDIATGQVIVTGVNVEGKTITDTFDFAADTAATVNGTKAFKTVTSVYIPAQDGTGCTYKVGYLNTFGVRHRLYPSNTTAKVFIDGVQDSAATISANQIDIEKNTIAIAGTPNGVKDIRIFYIFDFWPATLVNGNDINPNYSTSTSTSSSTSSTSTSSTSTSSTSSSTSSTSTSSTSTSSTSTSTTTAP